MTTHVATQRHALTGCAHVIGHGRGDGHGFAGSDNIPGNRPIDLNQRTGRDHVAGHCCGHGNLLTGQIQILLSRLIDGDDVASLLGRARLRNKGQDQGSHDACGFRLHGRPPESQRTQLSRSLS
jgi:hypothetical protein